MTGFGVIFGVYLRRALSYRWLVLVPTVLVFAAMTLHVTLEPDVYESHAVLMRPIAKPADGAAAQDIDSIAGDMFRSATERFMSTAMLLKVAERCDPYPELSRRGEHVQLVERLRRNIRIEMNNTTGSITVYATHTGGERPADTAASIVNTLTDLFVESQREAMQEKVTKSKRFLLQEKALLRRDLDRFRKKVEEFKAEHRGSLPDDVESNRREIERIGQAIVDYRQTQRFYQEQQASLGREIVRLDTELSLLDAQGPSTVAGAVGVAEGLLNGLELELKQLLLTHAPDNDRVVNHKRYMDEVRSRLEELKGAESDVAQRTRSDYIRYTQDELRKQAARHTEGAANLDGEIKKLELKIEEANQRILTASRIEGVYISLQRDVQDVEAEYGRVVASLAAAERRDAWNEYDSTTPFQVEQRAFASARPARPDRLFNSVLGLLLGLAVGVGLAVARHRLDVSYRQAEDLRAIMPGAVLVTIPDVPASGIRIGRVLGGVLAGLVLTAIFAVTIGILGIQTGWWGDESMIEALIQLR